MHHSMPSYKPFNFSLNVFFIAFQRQQLRSFQVAHPCNSWVRRHSISMLFSYLLFASSTVLFIAYELVKPTLMFPQSGVGEATYSWSGQI